MADPIYAEVRARDNHRCRLCARVSEPLEVHHILYRSQGGGETLGNLITLCQPHHMAAHGSYGPEPFILRWFLQYMLDWDIYGGNRVERMLSTTLGKTCRACDHRRNDWSCALWDAQDCDPLYGCNAWSRRMVN